MGSEVSCSGKKIKGARHSGARDGEQCGDAHMELVRRRLHQRVHA